ncbi:hypothetical protein EDD15DRAFT_2196248 [Pisolithus albus]|nr:hypothetical protein EDD15DRAFT_2196248 [Pisolithus albus]
MPDIMVRLFLFFFGYATCSLLHITLPQVLWLSTGVGILSSDTQPQTAQDVLQTGSLPGYRSPSGRIPPSQTSPLIPVTLILFLFTGSTTPEIFMDTNSAPHFSYGYEPHRVPGPLFRYLRTSVPQFDVSANYFVNPRIQVRRVHGTTCPFLCLKSDVPTNYFKFDVSTTVEPPSSDYVNLARVTLHATSRRYFESDVSTTVEPPSSDYVGLTGIPLDATSW